MSQPANTFTFKPLDHERSTFRQVLLHKGIHSCIECTLIDASFDEQDHLPYEAVSYTWGSSEKRESVTISGQALDITANLYSALCALRQPDADRLLWIDSICINQDSEGEKAHQVSQMAEIYRRAERVLIYLGQATQETDILMQSLARLSKFTLNYKRQVPDKGWLSKWQIVQNETVSSQSDTIASHDDLCIIQRRGLCELLARPWFTRVWVLQEVANARAALIYCGRSCVSTRVFSVAHRLLGVLPEKHCEAVLNLMPGPSRNLSWNEDVNFTTLLYRFHTHEASYQQDRIYALRGIAINGKKNEGLRVDYTKPLGEVILDTIRFIYSLPQGCLTQSPYTTIDQFFRDIHQLPNTVLKHLVADGDLPGIKHLVQLPSCQLDITTDVLQTASEHEERGEDMMDFLLEYVDMVHLVSWRPVIIAAAENKTSGERIVYLLLRRFHEWGGNIVFDMINAAVLSPTNGEHIIRLLLQYSARQESIMSDMSEALAQNNKKAKRLKKLLRRISTN